MTPPKPNGLSVPSAVLPLLAALPFEVSVWPARDPGGADDFLLVKGPSGWGARAGARSGDVLRGTVPACETLRDALRGALAVRRQACLDAADRQAALAADLLFPVPAAQARDAARTLRAEAARIEETLTQLATAWPAETP